MADVFLTVEEAARRLSVTPWTLRVWIKAGELEGVKISRKWRIPESALSDLAKRAKGKKQTRSVGDGQSPVGSLEAIRAARGSMSDLPFSMDGFLSERRAEVEAEEGRAAL